jgi:hypothetical protein
MPQDGFVPELARLWRPEVFAVTVAIGVMLPTNPQLEFLSA